MTKKAFQHIPAFDAPNAHLATPSGTAWQIGETPHTSHVRSHSLSRGATRPPNPSSHCDDYLNPNRIIKRCQSSLHQTSLIHQFYNVSCYYVYTNIFDFHLKSNRNMLKSCGVLYVLHVFSLKSCFRPPKGRLVEPRGRGLLDGGWMPGDGCLSLPEVEARRLHSPLSP